MKMKFIIAVMFWAALSSCEARTFLEQYIEGEDEYTANGFDCQGKDDGLYQDPDDCAGFIQCAHGRTFHMKCGAGTKFNAILKVCDWPQNVICPDFCSNRPDGLYPDPETCKGFIHCHNNRTARKKCPDGLLFNPKLKVCDWPTNVDCPTGPGSGEMELI